MGRHGAGVARRRPPTNRIALICVPYIALLLIKHVGENIYVAMRLRGYEHFGMSITLFDQLKSSGDSFYC